jgi:hypothetical protein
MARQKIGKWYTLSRRSLWRGHQTSSVAPLWDLRERRRGILPDLRQPCTRPGESLGSAGRPHVANTAFVDITFGSVTEVGVRLCSCGARGVSGRAL